MTILILDNSPEEIAKALDDKSLDKMIKSIAQVLCNVHWLENGESIECSLCRYYAVRMKKSTCNCLSKNKIPLPSTQVLYKWSQWARECVANYKWLVELGLACDWEFAYRSDFKLDKKYHDIIEWARDNVPELPKQIYQKDDLGYTVLMCGILGNEPTPFPLVMPKEYLCTTPIDEDYLFLKVRESYRTYYNHLLNKNLNRKIKCSTCNGGSFAIAKDVQCPDCRDHNYISEPIIPVWTKREKPDWLNLTE